MSWFDPILSLDQCKVCNHLTLWGNAAINLLYLAIIKYFSQYVWIGDAEKCEPFSCLCLQSKPYWFVGPAHGLPLLHHISESDTENTCWCRGMCLELMLHITICLIDSLTTIESLSRTHYWLELLLLRLYSNKGRYLIAGWELHLCFLWYWGFPFPTVAL